MNRSRSDAAASGLFASLRRLTATALELAQVRLELIGNELEEQKLRIFDALVWAAIGAVLLGVGLALLTVTIVVLFWDGYRLPALIVLTLAYLGGGALVLHLARSRLKSPGGAFAASAAELLQDRAALSPPVSPSASAPAEGGVRVNP